ncbi:calcium/sodium antiporter [Thalassospira sp. ER-Se-21-Dark]|uniref:calcium/sodium antiporter n=1 Tax=Thalassospira sp. ER-Se-21-Dark TaxID=2585190 RepID=UPI001B3081CD|nr:calcium/sodium antiporter [Thalassospira sp. ER-Se-21-Dark]MBP3125131.1 calcium/sodium antiporter [Thalassospira sp. ER-Se-21-Dark]
MEYLMLLGGLAGLFFGGESLVRGSVGIARKLSMSSLLIGLTVVGFGTSTPELLVSMDAALRGVPDIALGNVIGSNIANILLIVGVSAAVWPIAVSGGTLGRDTAVMLGAAVLLVPFFALGDLGRVAGGFMFAALIGYLVFAYRQSRLEPASSTDLPEAVSNVWLSIFWVVAGLAMLMVGAHYLVEGAVTIARTFGVSEAFIGLTIVAVGTSLPELATSLIAALKKQSEIAIGNIIGSNIFNILGILGLTAVVSPIPVADRFLMFDLPVMIAVSIGLTLMLRRPQIGRIPGIIMLVLYAGYVWAAQ